MNAIVRKHYPIEHLPHDLRQGLPERGWVEIEIRPEDGPTSDGRTLSELVGLGRNLHGHGETVVDHIRTIRDER